MRKIKGLIGFLSAAVWPFIWEFIRSMFYEQLLHGMNPYWEQAAHYGPSAVLAFTGLYFYFRSENADEEKIKSPVQPHAKEEKKTRNFVGLSPSQLIEMHKGQTSLQRQNNIYVGNWLKITAPVFDVMDARISYQLSIISGKYSISCFLTQSTHRDFQY